MTTAARPLDRFPLVRTRDAEEMCAALARVYAKPVLRLARGTREVDVRLNYVQLKGAGLGYTKYGIDVGMTYPESQFTLQTFPIRGRGKVKVNSARSELDPEHGVSVSPDTRFSVKLDAEYEHCLLVLNTQTLTEKLTALTGAVVDRPLRFDPIRDTGRFAARVMRKHFLFLLDMISTSAAPLPELVLAEFAQTLQVTSLHANRHNYSHLLDKEPPAEEFIAANAKGPIAVEDVAKAAGVYDLGLFRAFKKSRGVSTTEFASQMRLRHARELLQQPNAASVADVALICGFADLPRFTTDYAEAFGEQPSDTRGRGAGSGNN
jgi:AraC-like DNA-binding protein